jgi:hypothetical protein
MDRADK